MQYRTLTPDALADLRIERLRALEVEHARNALRREDAADDAERSAIDDQLADLERRHALHLAYAVPPEPEQDGGDGAVVPAEPVQGPPHDTGSPC